jgi:hypothetical protein
MFMQENTFHRHLSRCFEIRILLLFFFDRMNKKGEGVFGGFFRNPSPFKKSDQALGRSKGLSRSP